MTETKGFGVIRRKKASGKNVLAGTVLPSPLIDLRNLRFISFGVNPRDWRRSLVTGLH